MTVSDQTPADIARKAKSNLAFALATLPAERRRDMISFYAFCRVVDDIADDPDTPVDEKRQTLAEWRSAALGNSHNMPPLVAEVVGLAAKYEFPTQLLAEIIEGVASDQDNVRYASFEDLRVYCYKVASAVGLVSTYIFGATHPNSREYAIQLGYALQLTNIMRDVGEDARQTGRIYLPMDELAEFQVPESDILEGRYSQNFTRLMEFQYRRAYRYYQAAAGLLPKKDRGALIAARMMAQIYSEILEKLRKHGYRVFHTRERLGRVRKGLILVSYFIRGLVAGA